MAQSRSAPPQTPRPVPSASEATGVPMAQPGSPRGQAQATSELNHTAEPPVPRSVHRPLPAPGPHFQPPPAKLQLDTFPQGQQPSPSEFQTRPVISPPFYSVCRNLIKHQLCPSHKQCRRPCPFRVADQRRQGQTEA